jgi:hypothetical protein
MIPRTTLRSEDGKPMLEIAAEDLVVLVLDAIALLPEREPVPAPVVFAGDAPVPVAVPVAVAAEPLEVDAALTKRSVAWKVLQFEEDGVRGVYGGGELRVAGIDHVTVCPLVV